MYRPRRRRGLGLALGGVLWAMIVGPLKSEEPDRDNVFGLPGPVLAAPGHLVICGGGDLPEGIYKEFVRLAGGRDARLVLIPSAHRFDGPEHVRRVYRGWLDHEVESFDFVDTDSPEEADSAEFARPLESATGVWIGGGDQGRLADRYVGRRVQTLIQAVLENGGVVGGSSAGAAIMSEVMIRRGTPKKAVVDQGLGLANRLVIDQHFSERKRMPRLLGVLAEYPEQIGLGIDERTAVIVRGNELRVMGPGKATVYYGRRQDGMPEHEVRLAGEEKAEVRLIGAERTIELQRR